MYYLPSARCGFGLERIQALDQRRQDEMDGKHASRFKVNQPPRTRPCVSKAESAYPEQLG